MPRLALHCSHEQIPPSRLLRFAQHAETAGIVDAPGQRSDPAIIAQAAASLAEMFPDRLWTLPGAATARWGAEWADGLATVNAPVEHLRRMLDAFGEHVLPALR